MADERAIGQVMLNLLKNAREAIGHDRGTIRVKLMRSEHQVEVRVTDSGPGVPVEARTKLFEPFFTTKQTGEGTGLGLAVSRQIIVDHGGTLELDTDCDEEGTTFSFCLPVPAESPPA